MNNKSQDTSKNKSDSRTDSTPSTPYDTENSPVTAPSTETIAQRAYARWENEGRKHGNHDRHWFEAESELAEKAYSKRKKS